MRPRALSSPHLAVVVMGDDSGAYRARTGRIGAMITAPAERPDAALRATTTRLTTEPRRRCGGCQIVAAKTKKGAEAAPIVAAHQTERGPAFAPTLLPASRRSGADSVPDASIGIPRLASGRFSSGRWRCEIVQHSAGGVGAQTI
jgi:hypothetical protein